MGCQQKTIRIPHPKNTMNLLRQSLFQLLRESSEIFYWHLKRPNPVFSIHPWRPLQNPATVVRKIDSESTFRAKTMNHPEVSVVIPIFRSGLLLRKTIHSVLSQSISNFEIILVDNNADEPTVKIAQEFLQSHPALIRIIREPTQGGCSARNTGISAAMGKYIALLDEDDMMKPDRLKKQLKIAIEHPEASLIACGYDSIDQVTEETIQSNIIGAQSRWKILEGLVQDLFSTLYPERRPDFFFFSIPSTTFFPKEKAMKVGLFDERLNAGMGEDDDFCMKMFQEGDFIMIPEPLIFYRTGGISNSSGKNPQKMYFLYSQFNKLFFIMWERFGEKNRNAKQCFRKIASFQLHGAGKHTLQYRGSGKTGRILLYRAWRFSPFDLGLFKDFIKSCFPEKDHPRLLWFNQHLPGVIPQELNPSFARRIFSIPPSWL
ncbi:MAG: glycosyltransferase [Leptospirales bacterium]